MIDLRSDTVTTPTEEMLDAMRSATFGDDTRDGDPTVLKLEALSAERTGKQAAVFVPSGTMANLLPLLVYAERGGEALLEANTHVLNSEMGGISTIAKMFYRAIPGARGAMNVELLREYMRPQPARNKLATAVVVTETTHNSAGGAVLPLAHMEEVWNVAQEHGVPVHVDGARLFNAAVALGVSVQDVTRHTDSVCFCLNKGLSAPVGSLICGSQDFIERARYFRRMVGGHMRQSGSIAAAGIVALEKMVDRLAEDHQNAKRLAHGLHAIDPSVIDPAAVETNLVWINVRVSGRKAEEWSAELRRRGVLANARTAWELRFVTHRNITAVQVDQALSAFADAWKQSQAAEQQASGKTRGVRQTAR